MNFKEFTKQYAVPLWRWYVGGFLMLAISNIIMLKIPQLAKQIINHLADASHDDGMVHLAILIMVLGVTQIFVRALSRLLIFWPGRHIESESKIDGFDSILRLTQNYLERNGIGDFVSRLANDITHLRIFYAFAILQFANLIFLSVFSIAQMLRTNLNLTLLTLLPLCLMLFITRYAMPKLHTFSRLNQEALGRLTGRITEALSHVHILQANNVVEHFVERAEIENATVYQTNIRTVVVRTVLFPLMAFLAGVSQCIVLLYGGFQVMKGLVTVGDILAFNVYIGLLTFPLMALGIVLSSYQRARTSIERLHEIENAPKEMTTFKPVSKIDLEVKNSLASKLEIRNLSFTFESKEKSEPTIRNLSLTVEPGTRVGIYGSIGSGKTTLFNLITRIYSPPNGSIFLDTQDINAIDLASLRKHIGYAEQTVHLFSDSVRSNLTFGLDDSSSVDFKTAAARAEIIEEIEHLPQGWETEIGEKGIKLSGGQKQRLALARVLARSNSLLILDDVLSAVDHETEQKLIHMLGQLAVTCLISSHRPSVLSVCHKVVIMREGSIAAEGSFSQLKHLIYQEEKGKPS